MKTASKPSASSRRRSPEERERYSSNHATGEGFCTDCDFRLVEGRCLVCVTRRTHLDGCTWRTVVTWPVDVVCIAHDDPLCRECAPCDCGSWAAHALQRALQRLGGS